MMLTVYKFLGALLYYTYNAVITHVPVYWIRHFFLRMFLKIKIGTKSAVHMGCFFTGRNITIGNHTAINRRCYLDGRTSLKIGDCVSISPEVYIMSLTHNPQDPAFPAVGKEVVIEDYVWIGARAMILPGVTVSRGCVVGAGSVVTKTFPPYSIIAGMPAKVVGERNQNLNYRVDYFPFFNTDLARPKE
ncbi:MAG: acyltransferase [Bacteroidota bacterium]|jgi:acetyltransferase-like isoleucine patch superfamily enzyme